VLVEAVAGDAPELQAAIEAVEASGQTNIYAGLRAAFEAVDRHADPAAQNRVILLSDGQATTGVVDEPRLLAMAEAWGAAGFGLTTIGVGTEFDPELVRGLAERGGGAFYFLEDPAAVVEVFEEEAAAFLMPIASDVVIEVEVGDGYALREVYGTELVTLYERDATIEIPSLQIAHRESADDAELGRRGGGGAIVVELMPDPDAAADAQVGALTLRYRVPHSEEVIEQTIEVSSPLRPGETPQRGHFTSAGAEKAFVTLNLYVGFEMAAHRSAVGDLRGALGVLLPLQARVAQWEAATPDSDIADDLRWVDRFVANLRVFGAEDPPPQATPPDPWPKD
jgi:Ca-activated chloride channel family protein